MLEGVITDEFVTTPFGIQSETDGETTDMFPLTFPLLSSLQTDGSEQEDRTTISASISIKIFTFIFNKIIYIPQLSINRLLSIHPKMLFL